MAKSRRKEMSPMIVPLFDINVSIGGRDGASSLGVGCTLMDSSDDCVVMELNLSTSAKSVK